MWLCHCATVREVGGFPLVVTHGHVFVHQPLYERLSLRVGAWFVNGPEGVVHVEVSRDDNGDIFWECNVAEVVYGPATVIISSPLVIYVHYECGGVWGLVDL